MKKNADYEINFTNNTVTLAPKFYEEAATDYESDAARLIREFQKDGFTVVRQTRKASVKRNSTDKVKNLTYQQMRDFLNLLDDHEEMIREFDSLVDGHKHDGKRMNVINEWFRKECPQYGHSTMYEWAEDGEHLVHNPNPVVENEVLVKKAS